MEKIQNIVGGKRRCQSCHPKWRQIESSSSCKPANFGNSTLCCCEENRHVPPETGAKTLTCYGERILTGMDWGTRKIQLLTLLPQLCPLLIPNDDNSTLEDKKHTSISKTETGFQEDAYNQFLRDLGVLAHWPTSKKERPDPPGEDGRVVTPAFGYVDVRDHEEEKKHHGGMSSCQSKSKSHKKFWVDLKQDKFRRQFLRKLLAASRISTSVINAAGNRIETLESDINPDEAFHDSKEKKISVVKLLKLGLKSRYSSHIRKSLKEMDVQGVICILSIIANTMGKFESENVEEEDCGNDDNIQNDEKNYVQKNVAENSTNDDVAGLINEIASSSRNSNDPSRSEEDEVSESGDSKSGFENYKSVLKRVFKFLQDNPERMRKLCEIMNDIPSTQTTQEVEEDVQKEYPPTTTTIALLRPHYLVAFTNELKRLCKFLEKRVKMFHLLLDDQKIHPNHKERKEQDYFLLTVLSDKRRRIANSNRVVELKKALSTTKSKWDNISQCRETEIKILNAELQATYEEAGHKVFETVKIFETENMLAHKVHKQRLEKWDANADKIEERLARSVLTLDFGYKGLRLYRKNKEAELQRIIWEYRESIAKLRHTLKELEREVKENEEEAKRLDNVQLSMQDIYEEMTTTKRLRELLQNLQMAESVKENWAARRIQTAWKRYKARKLRKRKIGNKKPRKKRKEVGGGGSGGIGGVFFGLGTAAPRTVAERRAK